MSCSKIYPVLDSPHGLFYTKREKQKRGNTNYSFCIFIKYIEYIELQNSSHCSCRPCNSTNGTNGYRKEFDSILVVLPHEPLDALTFLLDFFFFHRHLTCRSPNVLKDLRFRRIFSDFHFSTISYFVNIAGEDPLSRSSPGLSDNSKTVLFFEK